MPEVVLLPGEPMPLHIFEERYKIMTETALMSDRLIVMGHMKPGWEKNLLSNQETYSVAGVGQIMMDERLHDGRFNLVLLGLKRIKIRKIVESKPYRKAQIEILEDKCSQTSSTVLVSLEKEILDLANLISRTKKDDRSTAPEGFPVLQNIGEGSLPLGALCDFTAAALNFSSPEKQMILEELDVVKRSEKLLFLLRFQMEAAKHGAAPPKLLN